MTDDLDLDELERLHKAATPEGHAGYFDADDERFHAAAWAALPALLAHARRCAELERERDELRADFKRYARHRYLCAAKSDTYQRKYQCTCGLDEARRRWAGEKK